MTPMNALDRTEPRWRARVLRRAALVVLSGLLVGCAGGSTPGSSETPRVLAGMVRTPTPTVVLPPVQDDSGATVGFPAPVHGLALVYFGYTNCPDVCPTTFADLRAAMRDLGDRADRLGITFVSVDPERDTQALLDSYVGSFFAHARALRISDRTALNAVGDAFGASFTRTETDGKVEVAHTAFLYALDAGGRLLVQWPFGTTRKELTADLAALLTAQEAS